MNKDLIEIALPWGVTIQGENPSCHLVLPRGAKQTLIDALNQAEIEIVKFEVKESANEHWPQLQQWLKDHGVAYVICVVEGQYDSEGVWGSPIRDSDLALYRLYDAKGELIHSSDESAEYESYGEKEKPQFLLSEFFISGPIQTLHEGTPHQREYTPKTYGYQILANVCGGSRGGYQVDVETGEVHERRDVFGESGDSEYNDEGGYYINYSTYWENELDPIIGLSESLPSALSMINKQEV